MALISLEDWNKARFEREDASQARNVPNGIACPECGNELVDDDPNTMLMSNPAQYYVTCLKCAYHGTRFE